jgi:hypothetical protein
MEPITYSWETEMMDSPTIGKYTIQFGVHVFHLGIELNMDS